MMNLRKRRLDESADDLPDDSTPAAKKLRPSARVLGRAIEMKKSAAERFAAETGKQQQADKFLREKDFVDSLKSSRITGRIQSAGRKNPAFIQGYISQTVKQSPGAYETRAETPESDRVVPLGDKQCLNIMPGDVLMAPVKARAFAARTKQGDTSIEVTSAANGLDKDARYQFIGIARTANKLTEDGDLRSAAQIAGVSTTINTGGSAIPAFAHVVVAMTPFMHTDPVSKQTVPGIDQVGQPQDKFVFSLHALDERSISVNCAKIRQDINGFFFASGALNMAYAVPDGLNGRAARIKTALGLIQHYVDNKITTFQAIPSECPSAAYAFWYAAERALTCCQFARETHKTTDFKNSDTGIGAFIIKNQKNFLSSRDDEEFFTANGIVPDRSAEAQVQSELSNPGAVPTHLYRVNGVYDFIKLQETNTLGTWERLLRMTTAGKSLNCANVGSELDLLVGMGV